jgi:hypothetical protein
VVWFLLALLFVVFAIAGVLGQLDPLWWTGLMVVFVGLVVTVLVQARERR